MQNNTIDQPTGKRLPHIDFREVKEKFSLSRICRDDGIDVKRSSSNTFVMSCPFHREDTPSCHIYADRRYTCYGCGAKGTVIDYVLSQHGDLENSPALAARYIIERYGSGEVADFRLNRRSSTNKFSGKYPKNYPALNPDNSASAGERIDYAGRVMSDQANSLAAIRRQLLLPEFEKSRLEAIRRRWWMEEDDPNALMLGAKMASEGSKSFLAHEPSIAFSKIIRTRRVAELFRLEKEFEESGRNLCVGTKKRLLTETIERWEDNQQSWNCDKAKVPRWLCDTGFVTDIPWEFDANEDAEILVICEGPGDGLRLYNEANRSPLLEAKYGGRWHLTAVDSCHIWDEHSIPRRPLEAGSERFSVGFFDGFSHIVILLDGDERGREGAEDIVKLAMKQKSKGATVRNVELPDEMDVCDFFDSGKNMDDLTGLFRGTPAVR